MLERNLDTLAAHRVQVLPDAVLKPLELLALSRWVLRGLALDATLMSKEALDQALEAWIRLLNSQLR